MLCRRGRHAIHYDAAIARNVIVHRIRARWNLAHGLLSQTGCFLKMKIERVKIHEHELREKEEKVNSFSDKLSNNESSDLVVNKLIAIYPLLLFVGICVGGFPFCCNVFVSTFPLTLPFAPTKNTK